MRTHHLRRALEYLTLGVGGIAVLVSGADHLDEYAGDHFSSVPTIGTLFLVNFIVATLIGMGLLLPWGFVSRRLGRTVRVLLALSGIAFAAMSLVGLWISETSSLFGFTDSGFRTTIVIAIVAESVAIIALTTFLARSGVGLVAPRRKLTSH